MTFSNNDKNHVLFIPSYLQCTFRKCFNPTVNCHSHLSVSCETIASVFSWRKPEDEHIFFISFSDWQIKAPCQEKLNETTINTLLQGVRAHTCVRTHVPARTHTQCGDDVRLPGANNNQLMLIQYAHAHNHTLPVWKTLNMQIFFFYNRNSSPLIIWTNGGRRADR